MSGYTVKITAKLLVANTDPKAMAAAAELLSGNLAATLDKLGFRDIEIDPTYRPKLKLDAIY